MPGLGNGLLTAASLPDGPATVAATTLSGSLVRLHDDLLPGLLLRTGNFSAYSPHPSRQAIHSWPEQRADLH